MTISALSLDLCVDGRPPQMSWLGMISMDSSLFSTSRLTARWFIQMLLVLKYSKVSP